MASIVFRDIPKHRVGWDAWAITVEGGFRGFQNLLEGHHQVSVWADDQSPPARAEVVLPNVADVAVFSFVDGRLERTDEPDVVELARSHAMDRDLFNVLQEGGGKALSWLRATRAVDAPIDTIDVGIPPSEHRFRGLYAAFGAGSLRIVQAAFCRLVRDGDPAPLGALLAAHNDAGERGVAMARQYWVRFVDSYLAMRELVPELRALPYLVQDLEDVGSDTGDSELTELAKKLSA